MAETGTLRSLVKDCPVSIALLTKNAGTAFRYTLDAITRQKTGHPFEIIIVDSGSTDETLEIAKRFDVKTFSIPPEKFNFGLTRNHAFSLASGEIIVTLSQDVLPCNESWLENLVSPFRKNNNLAAVQGSTVVQEKTDVFYWEKKGHFYFTSESRKWIDKYKCGLSFVNCAVRRDFWKHHQMGPILFSEDKLFQKMIHDSGKDICFADDAVCFHGHQYTWKSLVGRLKNEGVGWKYVGVRYGLKDCLGDIYNNKWMMRKSFSSFMIGEIHTLQELLFPVLRPMCIYLGNSKPI